MLSTPRFTVGEFDFNAKDEFAANWNQYNKPVEVIETNVSTV